MGSFISNLHVRGVQPQDVVSVLQSQGVVPAYVSNDPALGWVSIFPESGEQNILELERIGMNLSRHLQRSVIVTLVHDSDIFMYSMIDNGSVLGHRLIKSHPNSR
jgi:hypothetical protein